MGKNKDSDYEKEYKENAEEYDSNLDISLANIERIGSAFLIIGYAIYLYSATLDIKETLGINNTGLKPSQTTLEGAKLIFYGYIILYFVSSERTQQKTWENITFDESVNISPFVMLQNSYALSICANILRVQALSELVEQDSNEDTFV